MLRSMDRVGKAMRELYHYIEMKDTLYLVMDNAGGHGINNTIVEYTRLLLNTYNIISTHQVPHFP